MSRVIYIVEGKTESVFIKQMIDLDYTEPGKVFELNLMQQKIKPTDNIMSRKVALVNAVIDTDVAYAVNLECLKHNIKILTSIGKVKLWIQNSNFEEELCYMLRCNNIAALGNKFSLKNPSLRWVKNYLAQSVRYANYIKREDFSRYCVRSDKFGEMIAGWKMKGYTIK